VTIYRPALAGRTAALLLLLAAVLRSVYAPAVADTGVTSLEGFRATEHRELAAGVTHTRLVRQTDALVVNVARVARGAHAQLRAVLSGDDVDGGLERTSEMCRRVACIVAVNGDFHHPESGQPVGGLVANSEMLRSPVPSHHQLTFAHPGSLAAGQLAWSGRLMASDLRHVEFTHVNRPRGEHEVVLYSPAFGTTTGTNEHGVELVLRTVTPSPPIRLGQTSLVEMTELRDGAGATVIQRDGLVVSGHGQGAAALRDLWARVQSNAASRRALLRVEAATDASDSLGGSPVLVRDSRPYVGDDGTPFVAGRHPRTIVGWTENGDVLLVTIDGRQAGYSEGVALPEAASLMVGLGAAEALNLDGGGSTTLVVANRVVNRPSDRLVRRNGVEGIVHVARSGDEVVGNVERPVSVALAVVLAQDAPRDHVDPFTAVPALPEGRYPEVGLAVPAGDPASDTAGALPALVVSVDRESVDHHPASLSAFAAGLLIAVFLATVRLARRALVSEL
jgi:hypothetical protein